MQRAQFNTLLIRGLAMLGKRDELLMKERVGERCLTAKLAGYLDHLLRNFDSGAASKYGSLRADPEFGKRLDRRQLSLAESMSQGKVLHGKTVVEIQIVSKGKPDEPALTFPLSFERLVYPDVLVHERGTDSKNIAAIEVKLASNLAVAEIEADLQKLLGYCEFLDYKYGVFICLEQGSKSLFASITVLRRLKTGVLEVGQSVHSFDGKVVSELRNPFVLEVLRGLVGKLTVVKLNRENETALIKHFLSTTGGMCLNSDGNGEAILSYAVDTLSRMKEFKTPYGYRHLHNGEYRNEFSLAFQEILERETWRGRAHRVSTSCPKLDYKFELPDLEDFVKRLVTTRLRDAA